MSIKEKTKEAAIAARDALNMGCSARAANEAFKEIARLKATNLKLLHALRLANDLIGIEPYEHVSEEASKDGCRHFFLYPCMHFEWMH